MLKVSEILRVKGDTLYTATPDTLVSVAIRTMSEQDIGSLVIMESGMLTGMLTFREIMRHLDLNGGQVGETTIRAIMDDAPVSVSPNTSADEVQRLMLDKHARYIPVMDGPTLMGVISFYDMAQAIVAAQQFENNMLKAYIRDWPMDSASPNS
ncbi:CBS domain-containing protein [Bordetella hinzii]|uniref:CBS domain-containing protein n=2 Tax=Bordetella hinzii TaxID=103855 RepID=A0AAN1S001_9BORD|nr:CBS domain-containing protein [Bordetella hinzii]AKQ55115.1 D-arabinose 5-phosphate isomerase [Bordetella hinzii]AKQ59624.1 D-arabinose 5-phosphate isomerase [Bordetella hinzii]AZW19246.1 CBS domain-containing protein [Bordetella hinzii]KCB25060.1 CBS domain protein [Bordetella hinzii OH87 BAL007II]KCB28278.1 CBS domain protein [Bordetella hinzii L60]